MSITSALLTATSGLGAVARGTDVVASNIANADRDGYARRELLLSSQVPTGGVRIDGIARMVNAGLLAEYRVATAGSGNAALLGAYHQRIESAIGIPGDGSSLSDRVAAFEAALVSAMARPDSEIRLQNVLDGALDLIGAVNRLGQAAQSARQEAENGIARDVERLNAGLASVASLNRAIVVETASGRDTSSLEDARQRAIDAICDIIPLTEVKHENGKVSLFTAGGAALLDGSEPVRIEFAAVSQVQPGMTAAAGDLAYLTIEGRPLTAGQMGQYAGGTLSAAFEIRDHLAPNLQAQADAFAADLATRFGETGPDPTITTGMAGLITDDGDPIGAGFLPGLAQRLSLNAAIDPAAGGDPWRIRDGLYATTPGDAGDASLIGAMIPALRDPQPSAPILGGLDRSLGDLATGLSSSVATARIRNQAVQTERSAHGDALYHALAADGVDTDRELERLLSLEQAYAANARVIKAADTMLNTILGI